MLKKQLIVLLSALLIITSLIGCSNGSSNNSNSSNTSNTSSSTGTTPTKTITMWTFLDINKTDPREKALKQIIENFERDNPTIKVKVESQAWDTMATKFFMADSTGAAPDICWINTENLGSLVKTGAGADLNSLFINQWPKDDEKDFFIRASWDAALKDGKRSAVPIFPSTQCLFYRKDLFKAAGIDPDSLKTWDQFVEACKKLTVDKEKDGVVDVWGFGFPLSIEKGDTNPFIYSLIELQGDAFKDNKPLYATEAGVKSLKLQSEFITAHKITPKDTLAYSSDDVVDQFISGKYAVIVGPAARYSKIQSSATWDKNSLGILQWPNWTPDKYGPFTVKGWSASVWNKSKQAKEAAKFVEYMINPQSVKIWATVGGQVPVRLSVYNDAEFKKPEYAYMADLVKGWKNWSWMNPVNLNLTGYEGDISAATHKYIIEKTDPMSILKETEKKLIDRQ